MQPICSREYRDEPSELSVSGHVDRDQDRDRHGSCEASQDAQFQGWQWLVPYCPEGHIVTAESMFISDDLENLSEKT